MGIACEAGSLSSGASDAGVHSHSDDSRDGHDRDYHGGLGECGGHCHGGGCDDDSYCQDEDGHGGDDNGG